MDYHSSKHKELSEQLTTWWHAQTDFKTKTALATLLKLHPDTLGDYFSGRRFPKSDIANRLYELTNIACLKPDGSINPIPEVIPQNYSTMPLLLPWPNSAASTEKPPEPDITGATGLSEGRHPLGKLPPMMAGQTPRKFPKKGERYEEMPVVISLQRAGCPFCAHDITIFDNCRYCGQHFVWAGVPLENG